MARSISDSGAAAAAGPDRSTADDALIDRIIADTRATIGAMKCAMSERMVRQGISMAQLNMLYTLQRNGEMTMSRLADVLGVSLSNATGLVDRMEGRGFVERTRVPEDRRVVLVRIATTGTRLIEENDAITDDVMRAVLLRMKPAERVAIAHASREFRAGMQAGASGTATFRYTDSIAAPRSPESLSSHRRPRPTLAPTAAPVPAPKEG